jgi:hypothetical protein
MGANYSEQLVEAQRWLSEADKTHPNHYLVLQLLGMVYSEPRQSHRDLSLAEQYFDRAVRANPFDYSGHELLADLRLRRVATRGVDPLNRSTIEQGLKEARAAVDLRETSGTAHLLWAEALAMLLEIERDQAVRLDLRATLVRHADQADRFLSHPFGSPDPDLSWILLISDIQQTRDNPAGQPSSSGFQNVKGNLLKKADNLIADCARLEDRWVNNHRVFHIKELNRNAKDLRDQIQHASTGKEIAIRFW